MAIFLHMWQLATCFIFLGHIATIWKSCSCTECRWRQVVGESERGYQCQGQNEVTNVTVTQCQDPLSADDLQLCQGRLDENGGHWLPFISINEPGYDVRSKIGLLAGEYVSNDTIG